MRCDQELACDEAVLSFVDREERSRYGHVILKVAELISRPVRLPGTVGVFGRGPSLKRRIEMIAGYRRPGRGCSAAHS